MPGHSSQPKSRFKRAIAGDQSGCSVLEALEANCGLSRTSLKKALNCGAVWLGSPRSRRRRRVRRASRLLGPGETLEIYYDRTIIDSSCPPPVLLEQRQGYSLWYKPPGCLTQGSRFGDHLSLLRQAEKQLGRVDTLHPVHRLDREASGLVVLAHGRKNAAMLSGQFKTRKVAKHYQAIVRGRLEVPGGHLVMEQPLDGKSALTEIRVAAYRAEQDQTELLIAILTGRKHQIRRHLATLGHPVCGDRRYSVSEAKQRSIALCACELEFKPPGSAHRISRTLPADLLLF